MISFAGFPGAITAICAASIFLAGCGDDPLRSEGPFESRAEIRGTVRDSADRAIPGAYVEITSIASGDFRSVNLTTDPNGRFHARLAAGKDVGSAELALRVSVRTPGGHAAGVTLSDVRFVAERAGITEPDTVVLDVRFGAEPAPHMGVNARAETVLLTGLSGLDIPGNRLLRDEAAWHAWWALAHGDRQTTPPTPPVDFDSRNVLIAEAGRTGAQGLTFSIEGVVEEGGRLYLIRVMRIPCLTLPAEGTPVHVVTVPPAQAIASAADIRESRRCAFP